MKKCIALLILVFVVSLSLSFAQQDAQFSQNMYNRLPVNPAYAGSNNAICGTLIARNQWMGFDGAPKTGFIALDAGVPVLYGGVGLTIGYDQLGFEKNLALRAAYAFRFPIATGKLAIGIDAGFLQKSVDLNGGKWITTDGTNGSNDKSIPPSGSSAMAPDFSLGAYYNTNDLYFGISTTHLAKGDIKYNQITTVMARHYYIIGGYSYDINQTLTLKPSIWVKSDAASTIADINLNLLYNNLIWGGVTYRYTDAIIALAGVNVNNFKIGFSYDITTSSIRRYSNGTVEFMLGYCMKPNRAKPLPKNGNIRFLNY